MPDVSCPDRLRVLADRNRVIRQPDVVVDHARWRAWLPALASSIDALPPTLTRDAVRSISGRARGDEDGAVTIFLASQVWGYGTRGYGLFRVAEAMQYPNVSQVLAAARTSCVAATL
jgi:hypothetical protein